MLKMKAKKKSYKKQKSSVDNNLTIIKEHQPAISVGAMKKSAATNIPWEEQLSELIDNPILSDTDKCVNIILNMHYNEDDNISFIEVSDDSIGIPEDSILDVLDLGYRANPEYFLLGKMGMGMKGAIWGLGEMDYIISKTERGKKAEVRPVEYSTLNDKLRYLRVTPTNNLLDSQKSGTIVRIKRVTDFLPRWTTRAHFDKFVDKYNSMYAKLLSDKRLTLSIYYSNGADKVRFQANCVGSFPLMSNPRHILDADPDIGIGHNEPTYIKHTTNKIENIEIKTNKTCVKLTAWHKPTPNQIERYYEKTKNETYNPEIYKRSVFGYGNDRAGIIVMYKGKLIQFGLEKETSRETDKGILVEITDDSGLKFTQYKNTLVKNNNYTECMEAIAKFLEENGFLIRSLTGTQQVEEKEIVLKFLEFVKRDSIYQKSLGIINFNEQVDTWVSHECGETDIVIYDYHNPNKVICVIEAKKDRCAGDEAGQLFRYMAYHKCYKGILLSGQGKQPTFDNTIKALKNFMNVPEVDVQSLDVDALHSAKYFIF